MPVSINVRPFQDADAEAIVALYKKGGVGPAGDGQTLTAQDFLDLLAQKGVLLFLVAEDLDAQAIVGTLGAFLSTGQRVVRSGEVYTTFFFIDPDYRSGSIPNRLYKRMILWSIAEGYTTLSNTVSPANVAAIPLQKRMGLSRLRSRVLDYEGRIEMRGYQPLVIRAIMNLYPSGIQEHLDSLWRFLVPPPQSLRTNDVDSEIWHGLEVITYIAQQGNYHFLFHIDVETDGLVEMQTNDVHFRFYPSPGARVLVGEEVRLICELTNVSAEARTYSLSQGNDEGDIPLLAKREFQPQETWRQEIPVRFLSEGTSIPRVTLCMPEYTQEFHLGMTVVRQISAERVHPQQIVNPGEAVQIPIRLLNATRRPLEGTVRGIAPSLPHLQVSPGQVLLPAGEAAELTLSDEHIKAGLHEIRLEVQTVEGDVWQTEPLAQPALLATQRITYQERGQYILESTYLYVQLDKETGHLRAWEKSTGRLVLHEAWPDVGPPLPGGLKRPPKRVLSTLPPGEEDQTEGALTLVEELNDGSHLQRTLRLSENGLLEIKQSWIPGEDKASRYTKLKTYGWCAFRQDALTVPLVQGWQTRPVIFGEYPYGLYDYEGIPSADPPRHCRSYAENWSAFEEKGLTVGALWQDAVEVCFGKHWMPALLFDLGRTAQPICLPGYAYYIGKGGAEAVAQHWRRLYGGQTQESRDTGVRQASPKHWSGKILPILQKLSTDATSTKQSLSQPEVRITPTTQRPSYRVDNGTLCFQVAPEQAGGIYSLTYEGIHLLQAAGPHPRPFGDNAVWHGGIHPARVSAPAGLLQGFLCDRHHLFEFQACPVNEQDEQGQPWHGVALVQGDLCVKYEMLAYAPALRLVVEYHNTQSVTQTFDLLFHLFFRSMQNHLAKTVYYECMGERATMREVARRRRVYADDWSILSLGKEMAVVLCAEPGTHVEVATYEWPADGFQHLLIHHFHLAPGEVQRMQSRLLVQNSLAQLLAATGLAERKTDYARPGNQIPA